jgi:hypothetical protein
MIPPPRGGDTTWKRRNRMKRVYLALTVIMVVLAAMDGFAIEKDIQGKIGTGYATDPDKFGLDVVFQNNWTLDPYFILGPEVGFFWVKWSRKIGTKDAGGVTVDVKADTNAYDIPVFMNATLRLPNLKKAIYITPYATLGLGYSFMLLYYSRPTFIDNSQVPARTYEKDTLTKLFTGFTWQFVAGAGFQPEGSKVEFLGEAGYRNATLKSGSLELDMSGFMFRLGVKYPLGERS